VYVLFSDSFKVDITFPTDPIWVHKMCSNKHGYYFHYEKLCPQKPQYPTITLQLSYGNIKE
jgi:hypothetical protein